jgi:hypothetical protein
MAGIDQGTCHDGGLMAMKVSSEILINGRHVIGLVREDKGKMTALELEDKRDLKRSRVVLSKGHEVVKPGYSRVIGVAAKVTDKREILGNQDRVHWVSQNSNTDWQADRVGRVSWVGQFTRVSPYSNTDRRTDQGSWVNWVSRVDNTEQKKGGSSHVANMEGRIIENAATTEIRIIENLANTKNQVT